MKKYINRKRSYILFFLLNVALGVVRFSIFPNQTLTFHVVIFFASYALFIFAWEILLLMHGYIDRTFPLEQTTAKRVIIQIILTTVVFVIFSKILFTSASVVFKMEISPMLDKVLYLLDFLIALIFNLKLFGTQYFYQWKEDLVSRSNLEKERAEVKYDALRCEQSFLRFACELLGFRTTGSGEPLRESSAHCRGSRTRCNLMSADKKI